MYKLPLVLITALLLLIPLPAAAQTIRVEIIRAEVKCVTTVARDGSRKTSCSITGVQKAPSREVPAPPSKADLGLKDDNARKPYNDLDSELSRRARRGAEIPPPLKASDVPPAGELPGDEPAPSPRKPPCKPAPEAEPEDPTPHSDHDVPEVEPAPAPTQAAPPVKRQRPVPAPPPPPRRTVQLYAGEVQVLNLLNKERVRRGLSPVRLDVKAIEAARTHSKDMCERGYFDHTSPEGKHPWDRLRSAGARFSAAAENIAKGYLTAQSVHDGWQNSPGHRENRLNPIYTRIGVGLHMCDGKVPYWTELFMK